MEAQKLAPKKTYYAGVTFRSQLEAQFAFFFNACNGLIWDYEPFRDEESDYVPDFIIKRDHSRLKELYVEVKPLPNLTDKYAEKMAKFAEKHPLLIVDRLLIRNPVSQWVEQFPTWKKWGLRPWDFLTINGTQEKAFPIIDEIGQLHIAPFHYRNFIDCDLTYEVFEAARNFKFEEISK